MKKDANACLICGAPLVYLPEAKPMECAGCGRTFTSNAMCENGHFICDDCHRAPALVVIRQRCLQADDTNPIGLAEKLMQEPTVHMHGPEHHVLAGAALLTAYHNVTGKPGLEAALEKMVQRGNQVPGGTCGFFASGFEGSGDRGFDFIECHTGLPFSFGGDLAHHGAECGDGTVSADGPVFHGFDIGIIFCVFQRGNGFRADRIEL